MAATETYKERLGLLKTVPGIGALTAMEILTELQEISRFGSAQELASYLGLTPSEYSSGDRVRQGEISSSGKVSDNNVLCQLRPDLTDLKIRLDIYPRLE